MSSRQLRLNSASGTYLSTTDSGETPVAVDYWTGAHCLVFMLEALFWPDFWPAPRTGVPSLVHTVAAAGRMPEQHIFCLYKEPGFPVSLVSQDGVVVVLLDDKVPGFVLGADMANTLKG